MTFPIAPFAVQTKLSISLVAKISSNQQELNLRNYLLNLGWNGRRPVEVRIDPNVYVWSNNTANAALNMGGDYPGGLTIVNNGFILGRGGAGGTAISPTGGAGGPAINLTAPVTIKNANGFIRGGGGGGGFGGTGGAGSVSSTLNVLRFSNIAPRYEVGFVETSTSQGWIWNGVTVATTAILQATVVGSDGFTYNLGALRIRQLIGTNPQTGPYVRRYEIIRVENTTTSTNGGVGGVGGNGIGYNQAISSGSFGSAGGTNAGLGGSGGSGGDWGSNGISGGTGGNGSVTNGLTGSLGGIGGKAVNTNGFNVTFAEGGDRISGAIG
jgi:hypothetical protein